MYHTDAYAQRNLAVASTYCLYACIQCIAMQAHDIHVENDFKENSQINLTRL